MYFCTGEMAEWLNAAVLKTVLRQRNGGSNPSFSAHYIKPALQAFCLKRTGQNRDKIFYVDF